MSRKILKMSFVLEGEVLGLVSQLPDYKLAWVLNKNLKLQFVRQKDHEIFLKNDEKLSFTYFCYQTENCTLRLLKNQSPDFSNKYLLPEFKNLDYLLLIEDETGDWAADQTKRSLQSLAAIQFIQSISHEKIKSIENLMF
jgi:hypothetical protein